MHKHIEIANRYAGQACKVYTMDGIKAGSVLGRLEGFAMVRTLDGSTSFQVSWPTVARKMEGDRTFYAC